MWVKAVEPAASVVRISEVEDFMDAETSLNPTDGYFVNELVELL